MQRGPRKLSGDGNVLLLVREGGRAHRRECDCRNLVNHTLKIYVVRLYLTVLNYKIREKYLDTR